MNLPLCPLTWFAAALFAATAAVGAEEGKRAPNIIFILADDVSACELSPYGGAITMPNLQKLADDGVLFRNAWSTPFCGPSRVMLMTGKYPHHTGYYENQIWPEIPFWKDPRHLPLLKMMKEAGSDTSMIGKKHHGDDSDPGPMTGLSRVTGTATTSRPSAASRPTGPTCMASGTQE
jgi:arylsulfatase A-like enzyme